MVTFNNLAAETRWALVLLRCIIFFCFLDSSRAQPINTHAKSDYNDYNNQQEHRRASTYSELSTIPPDPVAKNVSKQIKDSLAVKYGKWHFWDGNEQYRPENDDLCDQYEPVCDVPEEDFPDDSWQGDAVFVNHFLNDAELLVNRAMEAIFEEYGHPKPKGAEGLAERMRMFHWDKIDLKTAKGPPKAFQGSMSRGNGGWTTRRSFDGLVRRILHAIMTSGTFTVVVAGNSAAAGHGNHFRQSYPMQFHRIMAPIFARLGVRLITRNISQGALGTLQNTLGSGDIYGRKIDVLIWDAAMTEKFDQHLIDLFFRQALIAGDHVPVLWSAGGTYDLLKVLHEHADADVGEFGLGLDGIELTTSDEQAKTLPWAVQYLKCDPANQEVCNRHNDYCTKCWIDRDDGIKPEKSQNDKIGGQVKWHPGWRQHQLTGRVLAFSVLEALQMAIQQFSDGTMGGPPLEDEYWHVQDYFENIQTKVKNMDPKLGDCYSIKDVGLPERLCNTTMNGRTHYTPRANFDKTGINTIVEPADNGYVPKNAKTKLYGGLDAHNSCYDVPSGQVDVLSIVSGRRRMAEEVLFNYSATAAKRGPPAQTTDMTTNTKIQQPSLRVRQHRELDEIKPGIGWEIVEEPQGYCDGSYAAVCARWTHHECVLSGHHDARGMLLGNGFSGWLVMNVKIKEGLIILKFHSWARKEWVTIAKDWTSENNARRFLKATDSTDPIEGLPNSFQLEYAIDGEVTHINKHELKKKYRLRPQRVVELLVLMDDPDFAGGEEYDVEVAVRLTGCGTDCVLGVSHIFWA
ncbi:expressed unknown protein [Seminavis robusta]|uniref:Uncharacterized protein n=1 Tax=Seminavis robusta TaxID=568900 RepID=A0A9N8DAX0_9STRA|nr:expressed unknown protein [Seminavis robusta]|eukprot:Sro19_g013640.1 n/a (797) ;mRNA; f:145345-147981